MIVITNSKADFRRWRSVPTALAEPVMYPTLATCPLLTFEATRVLRSSGLSLSAPISQSWLPR
jgi:hypothetical protein